MPLTAEQRAARRESRKANREKNNNKVGRNNLQGYQTESARLFGLSTQSSNDSSALVLSSNDSSALDNSFNSATNRRAADFSQSLAGIEEGLDHSGDDNNTNNKYAMMMQPPGQDAAQGGSPRHRVGPFEKDSDDEYYDEEGGETNSGGMINNNNPFLDDSMGDRSGSNNSRSRRGGPSSPEREFQPVKLDRSGTSSKRSKSENEEVGNSFDTDDDAPYKTRPNNLVASVVTTSSSTTQRVANTDDDSRKKTARDRFMEVMPDDDDDEEDEEDAVVDYGTPLNYDAGKSPFDDSDDENASQRSYEQPRSYKPFSGGSQSSSTGGEHYASMQELLEEERTRSFVSNKPSRFGGCVESCLGGKRTKRRKITLIAIVVVLCVVIGVSVYSIVLGPAGDKKGQVESQNMQQIERPGSNFIPEKAGNVSSPDTTFGMSGNSTDDLLDYEPTFTVDSGEGIVTTTADTSSPTLSPITTSTNVPTPSMSEVNPAEFKTTSPPSNSPTPSGSNMFPELDGETEIPTGYLSFKKSVPPTTAPTETFQPPTGSPSAALFTSAPIIAPTNPPISASVPSVQTDISGVLRFNEPVPQDTEANLITFLDALKKSIRSTVTSNLEDKDELVYVEIVSINGSPVEALLLSRRFIRRRMQIGTEVEYEMVVLTDCDLSDCTDAESVASDVFYRATNQMSDSVYSGEFASVLEVNVLSSSGGDIEYMSEVIMGDFSQPKISVLAPTEDQMANETSFTSSTVPVDGMTTNGTVPVDPSESDGDESIMGMCRFCEGGLPNPFLVVSESGVNCNQLKEAVSGTNNDSDTCKTVKQAETLCCALTTTTEDSTDESVMNSTTSVGTNSTEMTLMNSTFDGDETMLTNSTVGVNGTEVHLLNSTLDANETSAYNETISSNSTAEEWDFVIIDTVVGNETLITYEDPPKYENETSLDTTDYTSGVMDTVDSNETLVLDDMPVMYENGTFSDFENDALFPDLLCPDSLMKSLEIDEFALLYYEVVPSSPLEARNGILCARLEVRSLGWVGFALSRDGSMIGSEAVIGLPNENTVMKYSLLGKSPDMIIRLTEERQTLRETSIDQDFETGTTTMEFVKYLDEDDEIPIMLEKPNRFLYASGMSNILGYHLGRMSFVKNFAEDIDVPIGFDDSNGSGSGNTTLDDDADLLNSTNPINMTEVEVVDSFVNMTVTPISTEAPMMTFCEFCEGGLPDPFLIVSDSGLNCNQLKEAVSGRDSDSSICLTVKEAEGLCCEKTSTSTDTTTASEVSDVTNSSIISEEEDFDSMDTLETMNSTLDTNDSVASNETISSNSTSEEWDYVIIDTVVGNETLISYEDPPMKYENETYPNVNETDVFLSNVTLDYDEVILGDETSSSNTTSEEWDFVIIDTVVGNETVITYGDSPPTKNDSDISPGLMFDKLPIMYDDETEDVVSIGNETIVSNATTEEWDFVIIENVVGNETLITYEELPTKDENGTTTVDTTFPGVEENETLVYEDMPIMYENGTFSGFENDALYPDKIEDVVSIGNETIVSNATTEEWDFVIIENVVGNETLITYEELPTKDENGTTTSDTTYEDLPVMYENGTFSDFENDALYPILGESNDTTSEIDLVEPAIEFDELSFPFTLNQELGGLSPSELFGFSVAISGDGNVVAVGVKDATDAERGEVGSVRLYSMETSPPTLLQTLVNAYPSGEYGCSIALSNNGNRLVVGARSENEQTGVVRVYGRGRETPEQWALVGMPIDGLSSGERAGWSVSISGDGTSIAVGSPKGGSTLSGSVVTYRLENRSNWVPYGSALEGVSKEAFGYTTSISYDGNLIAVGSPKATNSAGASNAGKVSVFYLYGTEWLPLPSTAIQGTSANDIIGNSAALSQDGAVLVVGGKGGDSDDGVGNVGHCHVYEFETDWVLLHTIEGMSQNERIGSSVAVSKNGDVVACGGESAMFDGVVTGVVRVWNRVTSESSTIWPRSSDDGAMFGSALSVNEDGKVIAVGAPERDSSIAGSNAGAVDIFENIIS